MRSGSRLVLVAVLHVFLLGFLVGAAPARAQLPAAPPDKVGLSPERLARIGKALGAEVEQGGLPGAVFAVARKGKLVYLESFGFQDKAAGRRMGKDAIFRVYSMTKPWTSVAAMMLVEEGRIQLTDRVSKFLPSFKGLQVAVPRPDPVTGRASYAMVAAEREPTIQDLLRHTSGLAYDFVTANAVVKEAYVKAGLSALGSDIRDVMTAAEMVERLSKAPLAYQPGTVWEYSLATDVLGRVVEAVAGVRLSQFLEERIFRPLHMVDSGFLVAKEKAGRVAQPFAVDPVTHKPSTLFDATRPPANDLGGQGGLSTAGDYLRFAEMMRGAGQLGGSRLLSRSTVALMTSDHLGAKIAAPFPPGELLMGVPGYTFGLGFMVRQGPGLAGVPGSAGEFMWGGAAGTFFWVDPKEEITAVFMSQGPFATRTYYRRLVRQLVYQAIAD